MKRFMIPLLLIIVLALTACAAPDTPAAAPAADDAPAITSERCGDPTKLDDSINFYNWTDYIDEAIFDQFKEECGVTVVMDTYGSNEDLLAKMQAGATGYDVIVPSDYMITIMRQLDMLKPLDHANIPNIANLDPRFEETPYDTGYAYSVPYQWGTTGIGFDLAVVGEAPTSWAALFDPAQAAKFDGKISVLNDMRETLGAALKYLGYSINSTDPAQLEEAKQTVLAIKPYIATFESDAFQDLLVSGDTALVHGWSGAFFTAIYENEDRELGYVIPEEGAVIWTDNLAIPKTAPHAYTAEIFINYLLDAQVGADVTNFTYYASPNVASNPYILAEILEDPGIYPPEEAMVNLEFIRDLGEATPLWERTWTEVKSQ